MNWVDLIHRGGQSIEYASVAMDANNKMTMSFDFRRNEYVMEEIECQFGHLNAIIVSKNDPKTNAILHELRSTEKKKNQTSNGPPEHTEWRLCVYCVSRVKPICQRNSKTAANVLSCLLCVHDAKRKSNSNKVSLTISSMCIRFRSFSHDLPLAPV